MRSIEVHDMTEDDEYYIGTCSHVNESAEHDAACKRRITWLKDMVVNGLRVKVATVNGSQAGFLYVMPIETCPWGPLGKDLMVMTCLWVPQFSAGRGVGRALIAAAEQEARRQGKKALVTMAYYHDFWFMPASYFEKIGFTIVSRQGDFAVFWKVLDDSAEPPRLLEPRYQFKPVANKVVVDLFWNPLCLTSDIEAQRVREVAPEFGGDVVLNEYPADNYTILLNLQAPRGIFVNGNEIYWGYEAPREGIRQAISMALQAQT